MTEIHLPGIDLTPIVGAIAAVLSEPYQDFVAKLHAEGRITDAEVVGLREAILERGDRLADLVQERLKAQREQS